MADTNSSGEFAFQELAPPGGDVSFRSLSLEPDAYYQITFRGSYFGFAYVTRSFRTIAWNSFQQVIFGDLERTMLDDIESIFSPGQSNQITPDLSTLERVITLIPDTDDVEVETFNFANRSRAVNGFADVSRIATSAQFIRLDSYQNAKLLFAFTAQKVDDHVSGCEVTLMLPRDESAPEDVRRPSRLADYIISTVDPLPYPPVLSLRRDIELQYLSSRDHMQRSDSLIGTEDQLYRCIVATSRCGVERLQNRKSQDGS
jgi:hypothetical protein